LPFRVLHVLDHSLPVMDGYSHRSYSIVTGQQKLGWKPFVVTGPLHGLDDATSHDTVLGGIQHWRTPLNSNFGSRAIRARWPLAREHFVTELLEQRIDALLNEQTFDIIHAHSPALCGLAALRAARRRKLPFVYEIRSFWEDGSRQSPRSPRYRLARALETHVASHANALVGITKGIIADLVSRGIDPARAFHISNGVDTTRFSPGPRDSGLSQKFGLKGIPTIGFIGTLFPWEGIPWLVRAAAALHASGQRFKLLIIGDGADADLVRRAITECGAAGYVSFLGRVPHEEISRFYSILDLLVYPRLSLRITELVTPLKPLEAMALGRPILASSVGGIRELIEPGKNGMLFQSESFEDFCSQASRLLADAALRERLGSLAREWVMETSDWDIVIPRYKTVYETAARNAVCS